MTTTTLQFHPIANIFPLMEGEEFDALVADIKANALRFKIVLHEGMILDGRNRYRAMLAAGHTPREGHFQKYKPAVPSDTPLSYVITANLHRRHLTAEQKRDLIAKLLEAQPEKSDRQIGKMARVSKNTAKSVRDEMEARGQIDHVETRTDTKGRKQPAKKSVSKPSAKPKPVKSDPRIITPEIADRVGRFAQRLIDFDVDIARELTRFLMDDGACARLWTDLTTLLDQADRAAADPEASADAMKTKFAAIDDGRDPGPFPEALRRRS
jgi:hypothetical protein